MRGHKIIAGLKEALAGDARHETRLVQTTPHIKFIAAECNDWCADPGCYATHLDRWQVGGQDYYSEHDARKALRRGARSRVTPPNTPSVTGA